MHDSNHTYSLATIQSSRSRDVMGYISNQKAKLTRFLFVDVTGS